VIEHHREKVRDRQASHPTSPPPAPATPAPPVAPPSAV
jgi:hypothetical protein